MVSTIGETPEQTLSRLKKPGKEGPQARLILSIIAGWGPAVPTTVGHCEIYGNLNRPNSYVK
jgi:hypothetical protein